MPALSGTRIEGRYRLDQPIGKGGMATVWRARDLRLGRDVAVKLIADKLLNREAFVERFRREARIAAGLSHPNLVSVHDLGFDGGRPFLVMELVDGETLAARLEDDSLPVDVVALARTLLDVLATIHDAGIVHRDIKPSNVLYQYDGRIRLTDFGIARILEGAGSTQITETGLVLGTRSYMAPEVKRGAQPTPAADLYSLGVLLANSGAEATPLRRLVARLQAEDPAQRPESARLALVSIAGLESASAPARDAPANRPRPLPQRAPASVLDHPSQAPGPATDADREQELARVGGPPTPASTPTPVGERGDGGGRAAGPGAGAPLEDRGSEPDRRRGPISAPALAGALAGVVAIAIVVAMLIGGSGGSDPGAEQAAGPGGGGNGKSKPDRGADSGSDEAAVAAATPPEPTPTPAEPTGTDAGAAPPAGGQPDPATGSELNDQGYALLQQGQAAEAVPILRQAVAAYGDDSSDLGYAYALFNLGSALRQSGDPEAAIPILRQRLQYPDQRATVRAELRAAKQAVE